MPRTGESIKLTVLSWRFCAVGVFELFFVPDVPRKVVLNECIELAKELGDTNSFKFINGVLDKLHPDRSDSHKKSQKHNRTKMPGKEFEVDQSPFSSRLSRPFGCTGRNRR